MGFERKVELFGVLRHPKNNDWDPDGKSMRSKEDISQEIFPIARNLFEFPIH